MVLIVSWQRCLTAENGTKPAAVNEGILILRKDFATEIHKSLTAFIKQHSVQILFIVVLLGYSR